MIGFWQLIIILILIMIIFGGSSKFPSIMKDISKGLKTFKEGIGDKNQSDKKNSTNVKSIKKPTNIKSIKKRKNK